MGNLITIILGGIFHILFYIIMNNVKRKIVFKSYCVIMGERKERIVNGDNNYESIILGIGTKSTRETSRNWCFSARILLARRINQTVVRKIKTTTTQFWNYKALQSKSKRWKDIGNTWKNNWSKTKERGCWPF